MTEPARLEEETRAIARHLHGRAESAPPRGTLADELLEVAMRDEAFRTDLFRFIDVLPALADDHEVARHVREYLAQPARRLPGALGAATRAAGSGLLAGISTGVIRGLALQVAERFVAGSTPAEALGRLEALHGEGYACSVDLLGEATVSDAEAEGMARRYAALVDEIADCAASWPEHPLADRGHLGPLPRAGISLKLSSLSAHLDPVDRDGFAVIERL